MKNHDMHPKSQTLLEVHIFMSGKQKNDSPEFKIRVIMDMRVLCSSYCETVWTYWDKKQGQEESCKNIIKKQEHTFLEEAEGRIKERRGRACKASGSNKGRPPKLDKKIEEDLIAENQRLYSYYS